MIYKSKLLLRIKMSPPIQKSKHPRFRKKKTSEEKKKMSLAIKGMEDKNFNDMLYSLPLDLKVKIFQIAVLTNMVEWGEKEHNKNFKKTVNFINPNRYNSTTDHMTETDSGYYTINTYAIDYRRFDDYGNKFSWYRESFWSCKDRRRDWSEKHNMYYLENIEDDIEPEFRVRFNSLCQRKAKTSLQEGIKDVQLDRTFQERPEDIRTREWTNKPRYYWYHEKCRCRMCDRVRFLGYNSLSTADKEKFDNIEWDDDSKQWNAKSKIQLKYEKNIQRKKMRIAKKKT
tara:strand:+ start:359 stop:1213 length:855 start_codon:yes stop_codon:yes gene_type:complete